MRKKLLSVLLAAVMLTAMAAPLVAAEDGIVSSPLSDFTVKYSLVTKSVRVDFTPSRDIDILLAKAISDAQSDAFSASVSDPSIAATAVRSAQEMNDAYEKGSSAYASAGLSTYYGNFAQNLELYKQNKDDYISRYGSIFYDCLINQMPFDQVSFNGTLYRNDRNLLTQLASWYGDPSALNQKLDIITADTDASYGDAMYAISHAADNTAKQQIVSLLGNKIALSLNLTSGGEQISIFDINPSKIDSIYNMDEKKPFCNFFEEVITSAKNGEDAVVTLKEGTNYGFAVELTEAQLADIASAEASFSLMSLSEDGAYEESTVKATAEEQFVGISDLEDGEWVDSEEPITFTADGIEHLISLYPCSADDSIVPVRWYLDGNKEDAVEFENGSYTATLNKGRMPGGEHTLTVEYNHRYVNYGSDPVRSFDEIQQDDSITDSVTITFTANTFNFGEVSAILLRVFGMIAEIFLLLFSSIGG